MRAIFTILFSVTITLNLEAGIKSDLDSAASMLRSDIVKAKTYLLELKSIHDNSNDNLWLTKSNYFLGYIYKEEEDFGKAIIHFLEAIRFAEKSNYENVNSDIISLHNRCAVIFKQFKAYDLASKYYRKGIEMAEIENDVKQIILLNYNYAGLLSDMGRLDEAVDILNTYLSQIDKGTKKYFEYQNRLAVTYFDANLFNKAIDIYEALILEIPESNKLLGYSYHNLAKAYKATKNHSQSEIFYLKAISTKQNRHIFSSLYGYAELLMEKGNLKEAMKYFTEANELIDNKNPKNFEIYKTQSNLFYNLGDYNRSKHFQDLYAKSLKKYLDIQRQLQETDSQLNLDLITKRYFDEVDKQEKIASILFYSRLTSGGLLALLLFVIGYNRYEKLRVRKSIEDQLIKLEIFD